MAPDDNTKESKILAFTHDPVLMSRIFFVLIATALGGYMGTASLNSIPFSIIGLLLALIFVLFEHASNFVSSKGLLFAAVGAFLGLIFSQLIHPVLPSLPEWVNLPNDTIPLISHLICCYLGISLALRHSHRFSFSRLNFILSSPSEAEKVIDSSVLIDGRFLDVIDSNFLHGPFVVPVFVLNELQRLADSATPVRRQRGRRALDVLESLRKRYGRVRLDDTDYPKIAVDQKLLRFTGEINGVLMTTDYNLQKVAQIHQVRTLNLNELANVLKPRVFVGEEVHVHLDRRGKEPDQGVGYLDDGTMVVVEGGVKSIGKDMVVEITSILQSPSGRMVFARKIREANYQPPTGAEAEQGGLVKEKPLGSRPLRIIEDELGDTADDLERGNANSGDSDGKGVTKTPPPTRKKNGGHHSTPMPEGRRKVKSGAPKRKSRA